ncbi:hypothetical protein [Echinimonas agarilytica]|uniref:Lipoprotein n=1 Tax=Echinimonas agarilytica TaxID=1215918 RepID=A0AA41W5F4_9GAMM|nr:hypothetical protein [Echinimonas agarilytica]MCM2679302.1 hypothetical protein [Echinimonas agarilytica]
MELKNLFKLGAIAAGLVLAGCGGGDININTGDEIVDGGTGGGTGGDQQTPQEIAYGGFATKSTTIAAIDGKEVWTLGGLIEPTTESASNFLTGGQSGNEVVLGDDVVWLLEEPVIIGGDNENSVELTILPGTKILGDDGSYIVVSRGSKIMAEGTADAPIVMTSLAAEVTEGSKGDWGGLVLLGNAPVNTCAEAATCDASFEVGDYSYGGDDETDSSGSLKYVRVEFGGFKINDTQEMNGISFAGVGSGTEVDYIQVHENNDDGVEFWGGNVSISHVVLTNNFDDSLDWTNGWNGSAQHVYISQSDNGSNRGIEGDSNGGQPASIPVSHPTLANVTIQVANGTNSSDDDAEGIIYRAGTQVTAYNVLVKGDVDSGECLEINDDSTVTNAEAGMLKMTHSLIDCVEPFKNAKADEEKGTTLAYDVEAWFMGQEGNLAAAADLTGYMPNTSSVALTGGMADLSNMDDRLDDADYIGAFDGENDWTEGWTYDADAVSAPVELQPLTSCPAGTTTEQVASGLYKDAAVTLVCSFSGTLTSDVTLLAGSNVLYKVDGGPVIVGGDNEQSATLAIQAGVNLFGTSDSYIAVSRGSEIMALGTADLPIVMTSEEDVIAGAEGERAQWGGLVLLGNGLTNACPDKNDCDASFEVGSHSYGGNDNTDSSGQLSYVVVKYAGFKVNDTQEMNGISFAAVGSGTQVDHIQVHANGDDGVEFWGGAVNLKYVYLTHNLDDSWDWTNGWTGKAQFVFIEHEDGVANRGIEADSHSDPKNGEAEATPTSAPMLANVTILPGVDVANPSGDKGEGIILRKGTAGELYNLLVQGRKGDTGETESGECLELDGEQAGLIEHVEDGTLLIQHSIIDCNEEFKYSNGDNENTVDAVNVETWFLGQDGNSATAVMLTDGMPAADDATLIGTGKDMPAVDSFFDEADYIGAFDGQNNWLEGWTYSPK